MRLSVCMIVGRVREDVLNTLNCIKDIADEICILQTVQDEETTSVIQGFEFPIKLEIANDLHDEDDGFLRSFSEARNRNFKMATGDFILWIDSDDVIYQPLELRKFLDDAHENGIDGQQLDRLELDYDYEFNQDGICTTRHSRERVVRNGYLEWIAPIHEVMSPLRECNTMYLPRNVSHIIHNNIQGEDNSPRKMRNLKMLKRIVESEDCDARMEMYYANALFDMEQYTKAIQYYTKYLSESQWPEERYQVMIRIHNVYRKTKEYSLAKQYCLMAIELFPQYQDAFIALGEISAIEKEWEKVIEWMTLYESRKPMDQGMLHNPAGTKIQPLVLLQQAYLQTGDFKRSLMCTHQLKELLPARKEQLDAFETHCLNQLYELDLIESYGKVINATPEEDRQKVYDMIPEKISDYPQFKKHRKKDRPSNKKVLAIYCGYDDTKAWGPEDIANGIGGSEEAVINISNEFVKLGWTVEVYCNCTNEGIYDDVNWYQTSASNHDDLVDLCILWRHPHLVKDAPKGRQTWLWNHDLQYGMEPYYGENIMSQIDKVMFLSEFHRTTAPWVSDEKVFLTTNGVDPDLMLTGHNDSNTVIYASSPDRGLDTLLDYWADVVKAHPKAKLKVFYGFNEWFDKRYENNKEMLEWKSRLLKQMEDDPTITYYGSVGQEELAQHIATSGVWAYPTTFGEISCITAMKMQCGGVIPVSTTTAALNETVQYGKKIYGNEEGFEKEEFLEALIDMIGNEVLQKEIRTKMVPNAQAKFRWDKVAEEWSREFNVNSKKIERIIQ